MTQEQIQVTEIQALRMPAIAIRGLVMFPKMVLHFDVARQKSILALNQAMKGNQKIFLVTQKNSRVEEPGIPSAWWPRSNRSSRRRERPCAWWSRASTAPACAS